ncbi:hypothetical protein O3Q51_05540 [Cryomorphaceae bacterium 1068]|nr:hypothetical protein [Cryomorphaceae bacterium 1068]
MPRKFFIFVSFSSLTLAVYSQGLEPSQGDGSPGDPYQIENIDHLIWMSENFEALDKSYIQTTDIDAASSSSLNEGAGFKPIGTFVFNQYEYAFSGEYNGDGYSISNLTINRPDTSEYQGLFGCIANGSISSLTLENAAITGNIYVGILCGYLFLNSSVTDCSTSGDVLGTDSNIGGMFGAIGGSLDVAEITNCTANVTITATGIGIEREHVGGFSGLIDSAELLECNVETNISAPTYAKVGGFTGSGSEAIMRHNEVSGAVLGGSLVGGFVGNTSSTAIDSCQSQTSVESIGTGCGGFSGQIILSNVKHCYALGDVTGGGSAVGGFSGSVASSTILQESFSNSNVVGLGNYVGGFIGNMQQGGLVKNCYARGSVESSDDYSGGFVGINNMLSDIVNCYSTGNTSGTEEAGGFGGYKFGTISDCFWDTESSGIEEGLAVSGGTEPVQLTGKNTQAMKDEETYTLLSEGELSTPWDFVENPFDDTADEDIWAIDPQINNGYPYLTKNITPQGVITSVSDFNDIYNRAGFDLVLFPNPYNPASQQLNISIPSIHFESGLYTFVILDVQGKILHRKDQTIQLSSSGQDEGIVSFDLAEGLESGVYCVVLFREEQFVAQGRLVVQD